MDKLKAAWQYLMTFDPTTLRSLVISFITVATVIGVNISDADQASILTFTGAVVVVISTIQALWTKRAVVPTAVHDAAVTEALYSTPPAPATVSHAEAQAVDGKEGVANPYVLEAAFQADASIEAVDLQAPIQDDGGDVA